MGSRRWLGLTTAFALSLGGTVVTAAPARAADPGVTTLVNALAAPANSFAAWSKGLGTLSAGGVVIRGPFRCRGRRWS